MPDWRARMRRARWRARAKRRRGGYRSMTTESLMIEAAALKRLIDATPLGMLPYLAGTGPPGTVCEQCSFYGYGAHPNSCYRYYELIEEIGAAFPAETPSCRHFRPRSL
jgi:hypothetical protein